MLIKITKRENKGLENEHLQFIKVMGDKNCILRPLAVANAFYNGRSAEHNGRPFLVIPSHIIGC